MNEKKAAPEESWSGKVRKNALYIILVGVGIMLIAGLMTGFFLDHYGRDFITDPQPISQILFPDAVEDVSEIPTLSDGVISEPVPVKVRAQA